MAQLEYFPRRTDVERASVRDCSLQSGHMSCRTFVVDAWFVLWTIEQVYRRLNGKVRKVSGCHDVCEMDVRFCGLCVWYGDSGWWRKEWVLTVCGSVSGIELREKCFKYEILVSIVVSIPACHAGDPGSIPGRGVPFSFFPLLRIKGPCLFIFFLLFLLPKFHPPIHSNAPSDPPPSIL